MSDNKLKEQLADFDNSISGGGIVCINTKIGKIEINQGMTDESKKLLEGNLKNDSFGSLNSEFNNIFYKRGYPELITINSTKTSRFIKFLGQEKLVYAIVDNENANFAKVRSKLKAI